MVYRLNETTWLQDAGGGAEILHILNWAMLTIGFTLKSERAAAAGAAGGADRDARPLFIGRF